MLKQMADQGCDESTVDKLIGHQNVHLLVIWAQSILFLFCICPFDFLSGFLYLYLSDKFIVCAKGNDCFFASEATNDQCTVAHFS